MSDKHFEAWDHRFQSEVDAARQAIQPSTQESHPSAQFDWYWRSNASNFEQVTTLDGQMILAWHAWCAALYLNDQPSQVSGEPGQNWRTNDYQHEYAENEAEHDLKLLFQLFDAHCENIGEHLEDDDLAMYQDIQARAKLRSLAGAEPQPDDAWITQKAAEEDCANVSAGKLAVGPPQATPRTDALESILGRKLCKGGSK